ncbi:MAG TPA: hypothetical protein VND83_03030 [Acidimicrobiales bacterium]|nr:hypothetical protein [Acidimicrobiales bacterium]
MENGFHKVTRVSMSQGPAVRAPRKRISPVPAELTVVADTLVDAASTTPANVTPPEPGAIETTVVATPARHRVRAASTGASFRPRTWKSSTSRKVLAAFLGMSLVAGGAYAATNWIVGLNAGSSGQGQSATVSNLTISAVSSPAATNQLYPGGTGDVVLTISNPNAFPVTVTGVTLPTNTTYATGYTSSALTTTQTGCIASSPSDVIWSFSTSSSGSAHAFTSPVTVGPSGNANNPLTVTLTNDASMTAAAPAACENTYFSMPSLTGVAASGGAASVTSTPVVDGWTS